MHFSDSIILSHFPQDSALSWLPSGNIIHLFASTLKCHHSFSIVVLWGYVAGKGIKQGKKEPSKQGSKIKQRMNGGQEVERELEEQ